MLKSQNLKMETEHVALNKLLPSPIISGIMCKVETLMPSYRAAGEGS